MKIISLARAGLCIHEPRDRRLLRWWAQEKYHGGISKKNKDFRNEAIA